VGYDGSDCAAAAVAFGLWLAGKAHAHATLLHVCPELAAAPHAAHTAPPDALLAAAEQRLTQTSHWLRELDALKAYGAAGAEIDGVVVRGHPAGALLQEATARDTDLVLVGSTGVGAVRGALLGSVSSQVVEHAHCPVMVFCQGQVASPAHVRSVVVGVDGSPGSRRALRLAGQLAETFGARLVLVCVVGPSVALAPPTPALVGELRRYAGDTLEEARRHVTQDVEIVDVLAEGTARQVLVDACEEHGPAVLAVGRRGHGGFPGLLLGRTSRWVLNHAPCPVLVAGAPAPDPDPDPDHPTPTQEGPS
jgi:nucleotide-binding universal stress UspA family protein